MTLRTQRQAPQQHEPQLQPPQFGGNADSPGAAEQAVVVERSVFVQHGIHHGHFPVAGMRVHDARQTLAGLLNVDPQAVAVINGQVVAEDETIANDVAMLSFVKPSAIKG